MLGTTIRKVLVMAKKTTSVNPKNEGEASETLYLSGKTFKLKRISVPVQKLRPDPNNARIVEMLRIAGLTNPTQDQLCDILLKSDKAKRLMTKITDDGGIHTALFIRPDFRTVEGNTRWAIAYRKMKEGKDTRFAMLPCNVLPDGFSHADEDAFLVSQHVNDKSPWARLEKARMLSRRKASGVTYEDIAREARVSKTTAISMVDGFSLFEEYVKYLNEEGGEDNARSSKFSYFEECARGENKTWLASDKNKRRFFEDVLGGRWKTTLHVRNLAAIMKSDRARKILLQEGGNSELANAQLQRERPDLNPLINRLQSASDALNEFPQSQAHAMANSTEQTQVLRDLQKALEAFVKNNYPDGIPDEA
jgi:hypothetical protein